MSFFDTFKEKATDLAQTGVAMGRELAQTSVAKGRELAEIGKLKLDNSAEEDAIKKAYTEIGRLYYAERGMTPEAPYAALCEKITASKAVIESNNARAEEIRAAGNQPSVSECPVVTEVAPEEVSFQEEAVAQDESVSQEAPETSTEEEEDRKV